MLLDDRFIIFLRLKIAFCICYCLELLKWSVWPKWIDCVKQTWRWLGLEIIHSFLSDLRRALIIFIKALFNPERLSSSWIDDKIFDHTIGILVSTLCCFIAKASIFQKVIIVVVVVVVVVCCCLISFAVASA